jgi:4-diphosphocytidyl-2-C-methyl-D-erythritol kinase
MQDFETFLAPAKINLFLHIVGQRADGYHLLQSVFQLIDIYDRIHIQTTNDSKINRINEVKNVPEAEDLSIRAAQILQRYAINQEPDFKLGAQLKIEKHIPMGGGLGGGSSDAATVLMALNHLWGLNLSRQTLMTIGLKLGADVPFFIFGKNAWAEGVGERLQTIPLAQNHYVIVNANEHVSTKKIFSNKELTKNTIPKTMSDFSSSGKINRDLPTFSNVKTNFINDLEKVVCKEYQRVDESLKWLKQFGDARMSGSGASIFVEVINESQALKVLKQLPSGMNGFVAKGLIQHPLYDFCI